jgi:hypothetical protein
MTTPADLELDRWRELWQTQHDAAPLDLRARVDRQTRRIRWLLVLPVLVTIVMGGGFGWQAIDSPSFDSIALAAATWTFIAAAWTIALVNSRGTWRPLAETTAAYLDLSIRRCRSTLRGLAWGVALYVVELAFCVGWRLYRLDGDVPVAHVLASASVVVLGWVGLPAFVGLAIWYGRRTRAELARLEELRHQLGDG